MIWRVTGPPWLVNFLLAVGARDARTGLANDVLEGADQYRKTGGRAPSAEERAADQEALKAGTLPQRRISLKKHHTGLANEVLDGPDWERAPQRMAEKAALGRILDRLYDDRLDKLHHNEEHPMTTTTAARPSTDRDIDATLNRPATTTPSYADARPTGNVPGLRPNPGMLRALLQPVLFLTLLEPVGAFEVGDVVAAQFWGEGRVMLTPLPAAASRGRIPTTFPANQIHAEITGPRGH